MNKRSSFGLSSLKVIAIMLCCASVLCFAQTDRGALTGTITDPTGGVLPAASVTATNMATGIQDSTVTTDAGTYTIAQLPLGTYSVTVTAPGFSKLIRTGITVSVATTTRLDLTLAVGQASASVTVSGDAPLLQTESSENNILVTAQDFNELPINITGVGAVRDPLMFAELAPGTTVGSWNDIHIDGAPGWTYAILLDGVRNDSPLNARISDESQPSVESLGEFSLQQDSYSAEFGQALGGIFNYTTKSGANKLHGTLFNYLENEDLNAGQPFNYTSSGKNTVPVERQLDFGGSFGGPVWIPHVYNGHNRTFFYFAYEQYHDGQTFNYGLLTVPTVAYRNGDLSYLLNGTIKDGNGNPVLDCLGRQMINGAVYDPASTRTATCTDGSTATVRDPFPNNNIGAPSTWDPVAQKILSFMPLPSGPTADSPNNNYPFLAPGNKFEYIPTIKMDHEITSAFHISGYFANQQTDKDNNGNGLPGPIGTLSWIVAHGMTGYITADYAITPKLEAHASIGYTSHNDPQASAYSNFNQQTQLGLSAQANMPGGFPSTFPFVTGLQVNNGNVPMMGGNLNPIINNSRQVLGSISWIHGKHDFKFGGDVRHEAYTNQYPANANGWYTFAQDQTSLPSSYGQNLYGANIGNGFASFALGQLNYATIGNWSKFWYVRYSTSMYATDTWKLTPKLTLNYGLRWDFLQLHREQKDREEGFSPTVANPNAGGLLGGTEYEGHGAGRCNCIFEKFYPWMTQPRIGIMYQLDSKTVVHVSGGLFSGQQPSVNEQPGVQGFGVNNVTLNPTAFGLPAGQLSKGIPYTAAQISATDFDPGQYPNPGQINSPDPWVYSRNGRAPQMLQTNIGLQRELGKDLVIEGAWVHIRGAWLESDSLINLNQLTAARIAQSGLNITNPADFQLLLTPISSSTVSARGFTVPYANFPSGQPLAQALKPFPQFGSVPTMYATLGDWWYDAGQFKLTKRFTRGFSVLASYTWSKDLGTADAGGSVPIQDASRSPKSQKTYLSIDVPQMTTISFRYELPTFGFAETGWKRAFLKGWTTDGILKYGSGFPIQTPGSTNNVTAVTGASGVWSNRVPGQKLFLHGLNDHRGNATTTFYLNPAAWSNPALGTYATSKPYYGDYRNARTPNEQLGFGKNFEVKEGMTLSVRADFFNVFNRWVYPGLNNTSNPYVTPQYAGDGSISNGFGYLGDSIANAGGNYAPRSGNIVARFQF